MWQTVQIPIKTLLLLFCKCVFYSSVPTGLVTFTRQGLLHFPKWERYVNMVTWHFVYTFFFMLENKGFIIFSMLWCNMFFFFDSLISTILNCATARGLSDILKYFTSRNDSFKTLYLINEGWHCVVTLANCFQWQWKPSQTATLICLLENSYPSEGYISNCLNSRL